MKTVVLVCTLFPVVFFTQAQSSKDLPAPVANLQTLAAGSYVIPMDNTLQLNSSGYFNLKSYGLIMHLLNNAVKVKWAIKAGKTKDGTDFSGTATRLLPTTTAIPSVYNFLAGPFVIAAADTTGVAAKIQSFYTSNGLTGTDRPAVYKLTLASSNVDIRYDLTGFIPKGVILNDGANTAVHTGYMTKCAIPSANYAIGSATDLVSKCYTFASEPHIDATSMNSTYANAVRIFTSYGGNFLAQCEAVLSYENSTSGHFHTTNGISKVNTAIAASSTVYPNPDLAYSQYQAEFDIAQSGSVRNWVLASGSSYQNNAHVHASGGTVASPTPVGASVAKRNSSTQAGGLIFYIGNHEFTSTTSYSSINGIRMYMNAFLTPTTLGRTCTMGSYLMAVLTLQLNEFSVQQKNEYAELNWSVPENSTASQFIIERSTDAVNFREAGIVFSKTGMNENVMYKFKDLVRKANTSNLYYRIRSEDEKGKYEYSEVRVLKIESTNSSTAVTTYPNPVVNKVSVSLPVAWQGKEISYEVIDMNGKTTASFNGAVNSVLQELSIGHLKAGYYYLRIQCNGETINKQILKK
ncbi:T9SS type A sorting domain-containing protein [Lacibacter luteus]|uniref:T9SS type A sorting domain-containing protein n=1 Tax=Lacibacter luteus TaxID=2508719 RepID=A0A4Q1CIL8_9BACT|nr:T9SS type A sorting domain-containing protein [Lacibacter luteus]RXK59965.1 T9SS type A sorting domain-containing protein [Lacibacter luteus]